MESYNETVEYQCCNVQNSAADELSYQDAEPITEYEYEEQRATGRHSVILWLAGLLIMLSIFITSAIKNPSEKDGKEMVTQFIIECVNDKIRADIDANKDDGFAVIGNYIGMALLPKVIDYIVDTDVSDYVILSTFECSAKVNGESHNILSGIIVFGKIIPLNSELKDIDDFKDLMK